MFKISDANIKSITETKKEFSKIAKHASETGEPTFVLNHNKPEVVILSNDVYEKLVERYEELEEKQFYQKMADRVEKGPEELLTADEAFGESPKDNPFSDLSDEEMFD